MKLLFIGGTGLISSACSDLALKRGHELFLLNRSTSKKHPVPEGARVLTGDVHAGDEPIAQLLAGHHFDAVVDFIAFTEDDVERDLRLFQDSTAQFVFISSASAYQKPPQHYLVTEETPLANPYWQYSRNKIACEQRLLKAAREQNFPLTIVRPSLTYGPSQIPLAVGSWLHPWTVPSRMLRGAPVIVPGDGTSLWVVTWNADFAKALIGLLGRSEAVGETYQITSDEVLTWDRIYLEVFRGLGVEPNILHLPADVIVKHWPDATGSLLGDKIHSQVFDNSKIKRLVPEFSCEVNWAEGVRAAIAWHRAHPEFQTVDAGMERIMEELVRAYGRAAARVAA